VVEIVVLVAGAQVCWRDLNMLNESDFYEFESIGNLMHEI